MFDAFRSEAQQRKTVFTGNFSGGLYTYGKEDVATQEKVQKVVEQAIAERASDEWDVNVSESWSVTKSNFPNQDISIIADSTRKHYMMCKLHIEFYPKSGTTLMNEFLKRQQQSINNEQAVKQDLRDKKITTQQASEQFKKLDAAIWGAPSHIEIITNDFPLNDAAFTKIPVIECREFKEVKFEGTDFISSCTQTNFGNTFRVNTIYLGNYSKDQDGNLQFENPASLHWEKQSSIKIKIYGPDDVALLLLKKMDLNQMKTLLKQE